MKSALKLERRTTSPSISAREATANTGGPLRRSVRASRSCGGSAARAAANARRTSAQAASSASVSAPGARVCSTRSACAPSRELHTPSLERGVRSAPDGIQDRQQLPGRIVREQGFQQRTFGGGECLEGADDGLVQSRDREVRRLYRLTRRIAVLE